MRIALYIAIAIIALLMVVCYSLLVVASRAEERAERMYRAWKGQLEYDIENNGEPIDSDYNIGIDHAICVLGAMRGDSDEL